MISSPKQKKGPEESHSIHQMRATTVIFEEDSGSPIEVMQKIIYPNKPHASALHVEEIDTITFTSPEQKRQYQSQQSASDAATRTFIEEFESDNDSAGGKGKLSRGVSINSASEDELQLLSRQASRTESVPATPTNATLDKSELEKETISQESCEEPKVEAVKVEDVPDSPRKGNLLESGTYEERAGKRSIEKKVSFEDELSPQQGKTLERQEVIDNEPEQPEPVKEEVVEKRSASSKALVKETIVDGTVEESAEKAVISEESQEPARPEGIQNDTKTYRHTHTKPTNNTKSILCRRASSRQQQQQHDQLLIASLLHKNSPPFYLVFEVLYLLPG